MGKEYLVEGAKLMCINGSEFSMLKLPTGHGYTSGGKKKANSQDCKVCTNIPHFGLCKNNKGTHVCEGFMKLADKWENTSGASFKAEKVDGVNALTMDSVLLCKKGGIIMPLTSGQGYEKGINWGIFLKKYQKTMIWALGKGAQKCCATGGDPINLNTGNFYYEKEDLVISGITQLSFRIFYNAMKHNQGGCLGDGWHHNYEIHIREKEGGGIHVCHGDGREIPFQKTVGDKYSPMFGERELLKKEQGVFLYRTEGGINYTFNSNGWLKIRKDRYGNTDTFTHNNNGQIQKVVGANGGVLIYSYNQEGYLTGVQDHTGRKVKIWYQYGKIYKYVNASGNSYVYTYNENGKLESVLTPKGEVGVRNTYDATNRVVRQDAPDGGVMKNKYDDENMRTYMKEPNGNIIIYESDDRYRNIRTIYEDGVEIFEYNNKNQRTLYIDKNGNKNKFQYDERGNVVGTINALGEYTKFTYNEECKLISISSEGKVQRENEYNNKGKLVKTTDALGRSRQIVYGVNGLVEQIIQPDGSCYKTLYDCRGNVQSIINPFGGKTSYTYDRLNRVIASTDGEGNSVIYQYDQMNRLSSVTNPEGNTQSYVYNENGKLTRVKDFDDGIISIAYNCMNKPEKMIDREGRIILYQYDQMGNLIEEMFPTGVKRSYQHDKNNWLIKMETRKAEGDISIAINYVYDLVGNLLCIRVGDGKEVLSEIFYEYDALNRIKVYTDAVGNKTFYTYNVKGKISSITDSTNNKSICLYNDAGELTKESDIRGNSTYYTYNALGQVETIIDGRGRTTGNLYLPGGGLKETIFPNGRKLCYTYNVLGRVKTKTDSNGYQLSYQYDCMGRVLKVISNSGNEKSYSYDRMGNVISTSNANGDTTLYQYNSEGKLTALTDTMKNRTEYTYDEAGQLIHILQKGKDKEEPRYISYHRNSLGQVESIEDIYGGEEHYLYNALGMVVRKTDKEGYQTNFSYTSDGKIANIVYSDSTIVEMKYSALRQLTLIKDWLGETKIERNQEGMPIKITNHLGKTVNYEWGKYGEQKTIIYPDGKQIRFQYDEMLRLVGLIKNEPQKSEVKIAYNYDSQGRLSEKHMSNNISTYWKFHLHGQLKELAHEDECGKLDTFCFYYDVLGNKISVENERRGLPDESGKYAYNYDKLNRLVNVAKDGKALRSYKYDSFGNRTSMEDYDKGIQEVYTYNALNQLLTKLMSVNDSIIPEVDLIITYVYDNRGNLIKEYKGGKLNHEYTYNAMNRLATARDKEGKEAVYEYNGLGQRTKRNKAEYLLDLTKTYNNLLQIRDGGENQDIYWDFNVAIMEKEEKTLYYLMDEMGSTIRVLYGTGVGATYSYDEFGNKLHDQNGDEFSNIYSRYIENQPFGYMGYRYDDISETHFAQAREYQSKNGRFAAEDVVRGSVFIPKTINRYGYCLNNPCRYMDLSGKTPEESYVYYLNNMDGAKIFGHNAILVENTDGSSNFFSFMGTGNIKEMLLFGNSLGYMGHEELSQNETEEFLKTGDIYVTMADEITKNFDNYDKALRKEVTLEEGNQIIEAAERYINLFKAGNQQGTNLEDYYQNNKDAIYNLYLHNCDTVIGEMLSLVDPNFFLCQKNMLNTTPNNSFYVRKKLLGNLWEEVTIGDVSIWEKAIGGPGGYYILFAWEKEVNKSIIEAWEKLFGKECEVE